MGSLRVVLDRKQVAVSRDQSQPPIWRSLGPKADWYLLLRIHLERAQHAAAAGRADRRHPAEDPERQDEVVRQQFEGSLGHLSEVDFSRITIAYEPVWAIGTGEVATPDQAEGVHANLRNLIKSHYNDQIADTVRIQYGGSVKPDNVAQLMAQPNIDGALVGGASLTVDQFLGIVRGAVAH